MLLIQDLLSWLTPKKSFRGSLRILIQRVKQFSRNDTENKDPKDFVFIDEAGASTVMANDYGRAEGGDRLKMPKPMNHGEKFSMISAISLLGIMAFSYCKMAIDGCAFLKFIENFLLKKLSPGHIVFWDNIKFHKINKAKELIESVGAKLVFLPPYSPDLSPIENMWSKIKHFIRKLMPRTPAEFHQALCAAINELSNEDFEGWYENCGYALA